MKPAIRVDGLSKQYRIGLRKAGGYRTLRETITDVATAPVRRLRRQHRPAPDSTFYALKDVSFEVQPGEVVGIIGRNGAGKSTLLKVLSRITEPTDGRVEIRGRTSSLLEVGTGFHPELTGRENVYLNGSILGMSRREIAQKFDEIVAFSEIEQFLDTPVKRYSSGMYVRLAFAVAAHLEPEVLVVDEVLAVGDTQFQRKCLGLMRAVGQSGRTILFVSHNMAAVKALCTRCIYLAGGRVSDDDETDRVIERYTSEISDATGAYQDLRSHPRRARSRRPIMTEVRLSDGAGRPAFVIPMGCPLSIHVRFSTPDRPIRPVLGVIIKDRFGAALFGNNNRVVPGFRFDTPTHEGEIACHFDRIPLMPGSYTVALYLGNDASDVDVIDEAIAFEVQPEDVFGSGKLAPSICGPIFHPARWTLEPADSPNGVAGSAFGPEESALVTQPNG